MTLKEKFKQWLDTEPRLQIREVQLEIIADDFAIDFAEWSDNLEIGEWSDKTTKELLEIYKKQKGL